MQSGEVITLVVRDIERLRAALIADGRVPTITLPPIAVAPGEGRIALDIVLPPGYKVNDLAPSSVRWSIDGGITLPADADRSLAGMRFPLELSATFTAAGTLTAEIALIYCEATKPKVCLIEEVRLVAPFTVASHGAPVLALRYTLSFRP
ncbi:MAG: hypothetical protein C0183_12045 [Roseiflexus castenholzii]|uniref:hypothetical protein n=1 Tax=Roseiflexus castenholzii TaxID=120962 RepID=UPI000CBF3CDB|nr:MAG: hypothetical protein C0183_12045 [Roseiflexus castenholzii]